MLCDSHHWECMRGLADVWCVIMLEMEHGRKMCGCKQWRHACITFTNTLTAGALQSLDHRLLEGRALVVTKKRDWCTTKVNIDSVQQMPRALPKDQGLISTHRPSHPHTHTLTLMQCAHIKANILERVGDKAKGYQKEHDCKVLNASQNTHTQS